jgi:hypothetical protein
VARRIATNAQDDKILTRADKNNTRQLARDRTSAQRVRSVCTRVALDETANGATMTSAKPAPGHAPVDRLKQSAPSRVVTVASHAEAMGTIEFDDPQGERSYSGARAATTRPPRPGSGRSAPIWSAWLLLPEQGHPSTPTLITTPWVAP